MTVIALHIVHLQRDCKAAIDRGGDAEGFGRRLLSLSQWLFRHWYRVRNGTLDWRVFRERMDRPHREVALTLLDQSRCASAMTPPTCFEIRKLEECQWTFARVHGVELTNNTAVCVLQRLGAPDLVL